MNQDLVLIAAVDKNFAIGKDNDLPWRLPSDLKNFKRITMGFPIVMGRKTFDSIGKPLPGRVNIVLSRTTHQSSDPDLIFVKSKKEALDVLSNISTSRAYVIGGEGIYKLFASDITKAIISHVNCEVEDADAFLPKLVGFSRYGAMDVNDPADDFDYKIVTYHRK